MRYKVLYIPESAWSTGYDVMTVTKGWVNIKLDDAYKPFLFQNTKEATKFIFKFMEFTNRHVFNEFDIIEVIDV